MEKLYNKDLLLEIKHLKTNNTIYVEILTNLKKVLVNFINNNKNNYNNTLKNKNFNNLTNTNIDEFINTVNKYYPNDFSKFVNKEIDNKRLLLINYYPFIGCCDTIKHLEKDPVFYYICELKNGNNITYYDFTTIIHELTHGYANKNYKKELSLFDEVFSIFHELKLNNIIYNNLQLIDNKLYDFEYINNLHSARKRLRKNIKFVNSYNNYLTNNKFILNYSDLVNNYLIAYLLGLSLFYQDLNDSELAYYNINKLLNSKNKLTAINSLEKIDLEEIITCDSVKKYTKDINDRWCLKK